MYVYTKDKNGEILTVAEKDVIAKDTYYAKYIFNGEIPKPLDYYIFDGTQFIRKPEEEILTPLKEQLIQEIDTYNRNFIEQHYPIQKQLGFLQMSLLLQQELANSNLTNEQKQAIQQKLSRIQAVRDWMQNQCTGLYYQLEQQIESVTTIDELNQIRNTYQQQYEQLNDTDPKVTFKELIG